MACPGLWACAAVCRSSAGERSRTRCCWHKPYSALSRARRAATGPHHGRERECLLVRRPHPGLPVLQPPLPAGVSRPPACGPLRPARPPPSHARVRAFRQLCRLSCSARADSLGPAVLGTGPLVRGSGSGSSGAGPLPAALPFVPGSLLDLRGCHMCGLGGERWPVHGGGGEADPPGWSCPATCCTGWAVSSVPRGICKTGAVMIQERRPGGERRLQGGGQRGAFPYGRALVLLAGV